MSKTYVLTALSHDRPGVVEKIAQVIADHSGNWIESAMARLGGEFAGILRVTVPEESIPGLEKALFDLSSDGITVLWQHDSPQVEPAGRNAKFELTGQDHTGIVRDITHVLTQHGVSVDRLDTSVFSGSMSGEAMFSAAADIVLPQDLDLDDLRDALELIASDIMVEIELAEVTA